MRFSERIGKKEIKSVIQIDFMDDDLRNGLWNIVHIFFIHNLRESYYTQESPYFQLCNEIWFSYFKKPIDEIPGKTSDVERIMKSFFFLESDFLDIYDFIDFLVAAKYEKIDNDLFIKNLNFILKRELSGYRFINSQLSPITDEKEINEIEKAITNNKNIRGVKIHLQEALNKLSDRKNPDYRNSIKESISAVESICQFITDDPKAELGKALKKIDSKIPIHNALQQGFIKIYGYTSDGDGIRHAILEESNLDQEDALYMIIACSSFINYLTTKLDKIGLKI